MDSDERAVCSLLSVIVGPQCVFQDKSEKEKTERDGAKLNVLAADKRCLFHRVLAGRLTRERQEDGDDDVVMIICSRIVHPSRSLRKQF